MTALRLGTRRSALAMTQSGHVADALRAAGHEVELVEVVTEGDTNRASLASMGGTGVFASALREALHAGEIDLAVHSLKDLPAVQEPGLVVAAIPPRVDPRDALCARDGLALGELGEGSVVGTGSPRRRAQLAALGLGLEFRDIRGNLGTRLDMVGPGEDQLDAVVLAHAGLTRLGLTDRITELLEPIQMLPAPGQGALAVECRSDDEVVIASLRPLDDPDTRAAVTAERAILAELSAGCAAPVGALGEVVEDVDGPVLSLRAVIAATDGTADLRRSITGPLTDAEALGRRLARTLVDDGAPAIADLSATHPTTASEHAQ
ncbi:hydroxymethylbilane synthase [Janibacter terrae]|uniref:hydroxymethylbilane synthase n=1 Tax=Janibacter terrae TaxID=103817 RepID=UPI0031F7F5B1